MEFYSKLLDETIYCVYFDTEEQALNTAMALYNQESFVSASRFCNDYESAYYPYNPAQNFIRNNVKGFKFVSEVFKDQIKQDFEDGSLNKRKWFPSEFVQDIYNSSFRELEQEGYLDDNLYNNYEEFVVEIMDALAIGEHLITENNKPDKQFVNNVILQIKDLIQIDIDDNTKIIDSPDHNKPDPIDSTKKGVYFIQNVDDKKIKIGYSKNIEMRKSHLQTGSSGELRILGYIPGDQYLEKEIQSKFTKDHDTKEWYNNSPELLQYIIDNAII